MRARGPRRILVGKDPARSGTKGVTSLQPEGEISTGALTGGARSRFSKRWRRLLPLALLPLVVVGILLLLGKAAGYARLVDHLRSANPEWLALALAGEAFSFLGYILALRETARFGGGPDLGLRKSAHLVLASIGATRLLAAGGTAGLALDYWALTKAGAAKDEAAARVLALNTLFFTFFGAAGWLSALALLLGADGAAPKDLVLPWLVVAPALGLAILSYRAPARRDRLRGRLGVWLAKALESADAGLRMMRTMAVHPRRNAGALAGSVLYWIGDAVCLWAGLRSFDAHVSAPVLVLGYTTGYLLTLLPLPLGGVGAVDAGMALALRAVGVALAPALLGVIAYRLFSFWLPTLPAIAAFSTLDRLGRELESAAGASPSEGAVHSGAPYVSEDGSGASRNNG